MLKLLKRLFGYFTKQSTNTTDTIELSFEVNSNFNHAPISNHSHELSIDEYWNHWLTILFNIELNVLHGFLLNRLK